MPLKFVVNQKGGDNLVDEDGYIYVYHHDGVNNKYIWRCEFYAGGPCGKCLARIHTTSKDKDGKIIEMINSHHHRPDAARLKSLKVMELLKRKAKRSTKPSSVVVASLLENVDPAVLCQLASPHSLAKTVQRVRNKNVNVILPNPKSVDNLTIPEGYRVYSERKIDFLKYDSKDSNVASSERLLIFTTDNNLSVLRNAEVWYADGTFQTVPRIFYQLYTIHANVNDAVVPLVYVLVTGKFKSVYVEILKQLQILEPRLDPKTIIVDFEIAFIHAVKEVFPNVLVKGCFFHYTQAIWRKIQAYHLQNNYAKDSEYALNLKMLFAIPFVPECDVVAAYDELISTDFYIKHESELEELLSYYENIWLGKMNRRKFIDLLRNEQVLSDVKLEGFVSGAKSKPKRRKYRDKESKIKRIVDSYDLNDVLSFLRGIAHNLY
ncbi:uncharacterized protein [Chelonus insularis]|uniref:uncharacterized protein isoform X2 n=1 Tax=Chelonus insularis TaxID=460826 RepID=UPI00158A2A32|nr:uncharacterized protein LOC118064673 isoform X2 [Chelonus insularis]